jgi:hypothetical protein
MKKHQLEKKVRAGGCGTVYRACDLAFERFVASGCCCGQPGTSQPTLGGSAAGDLVSGGLLELFRISRPGANSVRIDPKNPPKTAQKSRRDGPSDRIKLDWSTT